MDYAVWSPPFYWLQPSFRGARHLRQIFSDLSSAARVQGRNAAAQILKLDTIETGFDHH